VRKAAAAIVVSLLVLFGSQPTAQSLTSSLLERYLESLRVQAGIPGMSALVLQDGVVMWERGFGRADIERNIEPTSFTPYPIGGLSQTIGSTLLLKKCIDESFATLNDPVDAWFPFFPEKTTTLAQLLAHVSPAGAYKFDLSRFSALTPVVEACAGLPYQQLVAEEIFSRLGLADSVPGTALAAPTPDDLDQFGQGNLARYAAILSRMARGYRVDSRGRATRNDQLPGRAGVVTRGRQLSHRSRLVRAGVQRDPGHLAVRVHLGCLFRAGAEASGARHDADSARKQRWPRRARHARER
jgi:CubicO group peptidase (beta-lactamase class C family)